MSFVVRDNGIGMSPKLIDHCFDLFIQGERTSERAAGGLGIGLALVKSLAELHGGHVAARSEGEGRGSTFTVTLSKIEIDTAALSRSAAVVAQALKANPLRVFVVDDNADAADTLAMLLDTLGYQPSVETRSSRALERIIDERPDICLLDIGMPDLDGYALAQAIRAEMAEVPVLVAVTGYNQPQDRAAALEAGFAEHFAKPVDSANLEALLSSIQPRLR